MEVSLSVYDVTNTANESTNSTITKLNSFTRDLGLGGIFHGAVVIGGVEWSFGYCEDGSGVYCCHAGQNSMYSFRETVPLGQTHKSRQEIKEVLTRLRHEWGGRSYDLLGRNCCHFCEVFCKELGVQPPPAWLNRFAQGADATVKFTTEASAMARRVSSNISVSAQQSVSWLRDQYSRLLTASSESGGDHGSGTPAHSASATVAGTAPSRFAASDIGTQSEPASRIASRMRLFYRQESDRPPSAGTSARSSSGPQEPGSSRGEPAVLLPALKNYIQGDGTKQFLFGLVRTRQSRFDEEEDALAAPSGAGSMAGGDAAGAGGANSSGAGSAAGFEESCTFEPTRPPPPQVISSTLLPDDVIGDPSPAPTPMGQNGASSQHLLDL